MDWKKFSESKVRLPEEIIEKLGIGFSEATNDLVSLSVKEISSNSKLRNSVLNTRFQFSLFLVSEFLDNFAYRVLIFGYDANLYPVLLKINSDILKELKEEDPFLSNADEYTDQDKFEEIIEKIFKSKSFESTVTGIMKIANKNKLPF